MAASEFHVRGAYQPVMREIGLDADAVFEHADIRVWRSITERENCVLESRRADGSIVKWHVKRHRAGRYDEVLAEVGGIEKLKASGIPTVELVGYGRVEDDRSFLITEDLDGFRPADKAVMGGLPFAAIIEPTALLAAKLHDAKLHHRDLYLCHFFVRDAEVRLIDAARVGELGFFARRWVVKDLAQFWYSAEQLSISREQRIHWLERYCGERGVAVEPLRRRIERKAKSIARHDDRLKLKQPTRNVSLETP
jgi:hypothetical protein